ncbi:hypothetical protein OIU84_013070 [Salix udensis]|uniref:Uncharacterized protein n=1 Tax=Salix udensis TaxID=889485 RepID=A0AAD6JHG9_9ROSI|nr:hypothetical protein OIU84_013070 [Salix udensis]
MNNEEEEVEKPCNACKSMRFKKLNKKRMISVWFSESNRKFSKRRATEISALRLPVFKICDPVKTNRDQGFCRICLPIGEGNEAAGREQNFSGLKSQTTTSLRDKGCGGGGVK